jgi:hypothetical protein
MFLQFQSPIRKGRDSGQFVSLQKLEGGATSRRNKSHLSRKAELFNRRHGITAPNDRFRTRSRQSLG